MTVVRHSAARSSGSIVSSIPNRLHVDEFADAELGQLVDRVDSAAAQPSSSCVFPSGCC